jgi:excisionase family DNA binding protein
MSGEIEMKPGSKYLRASEIVALTGMSIRTVRRRIADKTIPSTKLGGARLVAMADLEAALSPSYDAIEELLDEYRRIR